METGDRVAVIDKFASHRRAMDHFIEVASTIAYATHAAVVLVEGGIGRVIAHRGLGAGNQTFEWDWSKAGYKPDATLVLTEAPNLSLARLVRGMLGELPRGTFIRLPICVKPDYVVTLALFTPSTSPAITKSDLKLLKHVVKAGAADVTSVVLELIKTGTHLAIAPTWGEISEAVTNWPGFRAVLDEDLKIAAVSKVFAAQMGVPQAQAIGSSYFQFPLPGLKTMAHLYHRAFQTKVSTPEVEVFTERDDDIRSYRVKATPFTAVNDCRRLLDVIAIEASHLSLPKTMRAGWTEEEIAHSEENPAEAFLFDTLVVRRAIRTRGKLHYVSLRNWRSGLKEHQISTLKAIKRTRVEQLAARAGVECAHEINRLVGTSTFKYVVPVPCGHSEPGKCLAHELAKAIGATLHVPVIAAFAHMLQKGSSHPKTNVRRPGMKLIQQVPGPAILIDDVATSGRHLEEANDILQAEGVETFAMAWIAD
jgi:hypothetical protein